MARGGTLQRLCERRLICGLRISEDPTSDNVTPQETAKRDTLDVGVDGTGLSCAGSSVVTECASSRADNKAK